MLYRMVCFGLAACSAMLLTTSLPGDEDMNGTTSQENAWLHYPGGEGPGEGKHIVLIAAEQEYRSEESMPMLARILSKHHGFDCTVLFSVNEKGEVDPTLPAPFEDRSRRHRIPGLEKLKSADCVIWLSRFLQLPDDQKDLFHEYFDSGKPLVALRTANHGFWGGKPYTLDGKNVPLRDLLGGTFQGHHGGWHREATRGVIVEGSKDHPILAGVTDIFGTSDVYRCHDDKFPFPADCTALVLGQPLVNLQQDAAPNTNKEPLPVAWTKTWKGNRGLDSRIVHFTMGSAEDFENAGVRRLTINGVYWGLGLEDAIRAESSVDIVGVYKPKKAGFNYVELGVVPQPVSHYRD
jgi:type 1 glutamine amidotransferase